MSEPGRYPDPREEDIFAGDRRISRPDASVPDWEVPDSAYRPIPIVWFTGAFLLQMGVLFALFLILSDANGLITIGLSALASGLILAWTWDRGMKNVSGGWKFTTVAMLAVQFLFVCAGSIGRI